MLNNCSINKNASNFWRSTLRNNRNHYCIKLLDFSSFSPGFSRLLRKLQKILKNDLYNSQTRQCSLPGTPPEVDEQNKFQVEECSQTLNKTHTQTHHCKTNIFLIEPKIQSDDINIIISITAVSSINYISIMDPVGKICYCYIIFTYLTCSFIVWPSFQY